MSNHPTNTIQSIPANDTLTVERRFSPDQLGRALPLFKSVQALRWETGAMTPAEEETLCRMWVCEACALLEEADLPDEDRNACLWIKRVVKAIASGRFYVHGLAREHQGNWRLLTRDLERQLRSVRHKLERGERHRKSSVINAARQEPVAGPTFPSLEGSTILVIGGEADSAVLDHLRDASFSLDWIPDNIRKIQPAVERIRRGRVDGVVFLTDLNGHVTFAMVRNACRFRRTPMVMGTKGVAGVVRALEQLDEQLVRASA